MFAWFLISLATPTQDATPITTYRSVPAQEVTMHKSLVCGETTFEIHYTQIDGVVVGSLIAKHGDTLMQSSDVQSELFDKLALVDGTSVTCGFEDRPSTVLISGVDRETRVVDQLYRVGFLPGEGFGKISAPDD